MKKRGQVTLFIIIGLIVVLLIAILLFSQRQTIKHFFENYYTPSTTLPPEAQKTQDLIQNCLDTNSNIILHLIGLQGGYTQPSKNSFQNIAYAYQNKKNLLPSKQKIESQISAYIENNIPNCTIIQTLEPEVTTLIEQDSVKIILDYPVTITRLNTSYKLPDTYTTINQIPLGKIHDLATSIIQKEIENPNIIDISNLLSTDLNISILSFNETIVYSIESENYKFLFANKI